MTDEQRTDATTEEAASTTTTETATASNDAATATAGNSAAATGKTDGQGKATIATGGDTEAEAAAKDAASKPYWPENWREKAAEHLSAGDKKAYDKELKRLQRISDPAAVYGMYRDLESKFTSGGLIKVPGKDAKPEDIAAYHKALGVPEKAEDYLKDLKLDNGAVIGDADKPLLQSVTAELHKAGATPAVVNTMVNWYYKQQEQAAANLDEADDAFRRESEQALKEELGASFKRKVNAIASLFASAPGGADVKNENSLFARLVGGRTADGRIIGNDPDVMRFLVSLVQEVNPAATVVEDGNQSGVSLDQEIAQIEKVMRTNRREYNTKYADRYAELLATREKIRARG